MREEVDRMNDIVTGYLDFARPDNRLTGKAEPQQTNITELFVSLKKHVDEAYRDTERWTRMSIINAASSGKFSTDRTMQNYNEEIWKLAPLAPEF